MSDFIKRLMCVLFGVITISGLVMFISGASDFFKINFSTPIDINDVDSSKFTENTLVSGEVYYVIDSVASAYSNDIINQTKITYYLIPIKSGKYITVATGNSSQITMFDKIFQQTCQYLNKEIEDTFTYTSINGKIFPLDDELKELIYSWCDTTNYFQTSDRTTIDKQILPYIIYTQDWNSINVLTIIGIISTILGAIGLIIFIKLIKKSKQ